MNTDSFIIPESYTVAQTIDAMLRYAVTVRASDIHLDPRAADILVRVRVDGCMLEAGTISSRLFGELIARLKILSGARTDIHAIPQDGRFQSSIADGTYNIRASFMPTYHGENAVLRLLSSSARAVSLSRLGFTADHVRMVERALSRTHGLILVTGPTGSGKTTTLHACLAAKAREPLSIITLEDPVEYEIPGIRQVHVRHTHGVTFASGLRSALRQDPDVIMVGEIRDQETAAVVIHTALTGHLVLSTLHTNSALEAIPRLVDMGVDHYLLATTLKLVIAERLVRLACEHCYALGCENCRQKGYVGRSIIAEVLDVDDELSRLIACRASLAEIADAAYARGFHPLAEDGDEKINWGITTREEVARVLSSV
ncbi:MAG: type II/IV secretion system protein [Patescibacteria group bacterium]|nr:type II/IV secretion system protein [Patescibacteria group bacterium]MDE2172555.1 type II/IV secretion system protein [Patescibacteria group bacterium]